MKKWIQVLLAALVIAIVVGVFLVMLSPSRAPQAIVLPSPNGYDDLLMAGAQVSAPPPSAADTKLEELRTMVRNNAVGLKAARAGLDKECMVPTDYSMQYMSAHLPDLAKIKALAQAFAAEARLALREGRTNDAAQSFLDAVRLGIAASRNGLILDRLVGCACEAIGQAGVRSLVDGLDKEQALNAAAELRRVDRLSPTTDDVMTRERTFARRAHPFPAGIYLAIQRSMANSPFKRSEAAFVQKVHQVTRERRQMVIDLAAQAYLADKGVRPATAADLIPGYLEAVPADPQTGRPLALRPE